MKRSPLDMQAQLVFVHGWGFEPHFWDPLVAMLRYPSVRQINLGYYGDHFDLDENDDIPKILIGHSLGFVHGIKHYKNIRAWVAINSFMRFVTNAQDLGCSPPAAIDDLRQRLHRNSGLSLQRFYNFVGGEPSTTQLVNIAPLLRGLDALQEGAVGPRLDELAVPGLVLASVHDPLVPQATSQALGQKSRAGQALFFETESHLLPQAEPGWCCTAITHFLNTAQL